MTSPRICRLQERLSSSEHDKKEESALYCRMAYDIYGKNTEKPEILRKAEFLTAFADKLPAVCASEELIVGSMRFWTLDIWQSKDFHGNLGHIIVDYGRVLEKGVCSLQEEIAGIPETDGRSIRNKQAFSQTIAAFSRYIERHAEEALRLAAETQNPETQTELRNIAENCLHISKSAPRTFWEALQFVWFVHVFLHAEGMIAAYSFGRFDQYLYPYYQRDLEKGILGRQQAKELLGCFWLKTCEGDESQNLTLGGDGENELSLLCLEVTRELSVWQPSVSVRIGSGTTTSLWDETLRLVKTGIGMPAIFNDDVVQKALINTGISREDANNYGIVGCYEANPQGNALGLTVAGGLRLYEVLLNFLAIGTGYASFELLYADFKAYFVGKYISTYLPGYRERWEHITEHTPSPFESICLSDCLEKGLAAEEGGGKYTMFGINILGLGTTVDSLYVLKRLVFEEKKLGLAEFTDTVRADFPDNDLFLECRNMAGKYGTDREPTNGLAHDLSSFVARTVLDNRFREDVITYPGLFLFTADIRSGSIPATPDGRRRGERVSYGIGASDFCSGMTVTSVLNSAANVANDLCACGNPLMLSFSKSDLETQKGDEILRSLIQSYFDRGGFHLQFNVVSADKLEEAKHSPDSFSRLLVRISGFSARFVSLDGELQDAIIERTRKGH